jgi:nucleotide-binding universal stress UspA family protein
MGEVGEMFERILIPLDGSRFGSQALKNAVEVAKRFNAEIFLLQVVRQAIPVMASSGITPGTESPMSAEISLKVAATQDKENVTRARRYLSRKAQEVRSKGISVSYDVIMGEPADGIMTFARKHKVDLIVMSSHGKGGLKRAILGSVADEVIRESGKPVLVVRPKTRKSR